MLYSTVTWRVGCMCCSEAGATVEETICENTLFAQVPGCCWGVRLFSLLWYSPFFLTQQFRAAQFKLKSPPYD